MSEIILNIIIVQVRYLPRFCGHRHQLIEQTTKHSAATQLYPNAIDGEKCSTKESLPKTVQMYHKRMLSAMACFADFNDAVGLEGHAFGIAQVRTPCP
jgi:hypothetical protein